MVEEAHSALTAHPCSAGSRPFNQKRFRPPQRIAATGHSTRQSRPCPIHRTTSLRRSPCVQYNYIFCFVPTTGQMGHTPRISETSRFPPPVMQWPYGAAGLAFRILGSDPYWPEGRSRSGCNGPFAGPFVHAPAVQPKPLAVLRKPEQEASEAA